MQNKPLANTLKLIARHGPDCFYKYMPEKGCDIAKGIVEGQTFNRPQAPGGKGGSMTLDDLANYRAIEARAGRRQYRGYGSRPPMPPSSGGLTLLQMLKMLERFPIGDASQGYGFGSVKTGQRDGRRDAPGLCRSSIWMGDTDFVPVPIRACWTPTYTGLRGAAIVPGPRIAPNPFPATRGLMRSRACGPARAWRWRSR